MGGTPVIRTVRRKFMKREQWIEKGFSEEQTTEVLDEFHGLNQQVEKLKKELESSKVQSAKVAELQKQLDEINKSKMTEQEQAEAKKKEADDYLANAQKIYNTAKAKEILAGYDVEETLIANLVGGDEQSTIENASKLKALIDGKVEATTLKVKEEFANQSAKPNPSNVPPNNDVMTKEKFDKLTMSEQKAWKDAHIDEYHEFYPQK